MGFAWDDDKDRWLKAARGTTFKELLATEFVAVIKHPNRANQSYLLFLFDGYIWAAPCVNRGDELFLKTAFPSRKYTKAWKRGEIP